MAIVVKNLFRHFSRFKAVDGVSFEVAEGKLAALLGPSGSGKSTILRIIAGLERPDRGSVILEGEDVTYLPPQKRGIGFVFQQYALFKSMTVWQNIAFGLEVRKVPKEKIRERVAELLELVQLQGYEKRYPLQLSGGQRQRVALARALAPKPRLLLLDEPFGALDAKVREELREWIRRLHEEVHVTSLFVTHDQEEALEISDTVMIIHEGKIEQQGTPKEVYDHPATPFVTGFIGPVNVLKGPMLQGTMNLGGAADGKSMTAYIRPHDLHLGVAAGGKTTFPATLKRILNVGPMVKAELALQDGTQLLVHLSREKFQELKLDIGKTVYVGLGDMKIFTDDYVI